MKVHQIVAAMAPGDAVSNQVLAWKRALADSGVDGEVFAQHVVDPELAVQVKLLEQIPDDGAVILHYSIWSAAAERFMELDPARGLAMVHHNVTPPEFLHENPAVASLCAQGRAQAPEVARRAQVVIADSQYNADELRLPTGRAVVVPLLLDLPQPQPPRDHVSPLVLTVGRVVPSKRLENVIRAVALLRARRPEAHLRIIGSWEGFPRYRKSLDDLVKRLEVGDAVEFLGHVDDQTRDRSYAEAGAYINLSAHEGFCVPLLEAMAAGLPVVASGTAAIPETVADAALLAPDGDPLFAAEALHLVLGDASARQSLYSAAASRLDALSSRVVRPRLLEALAPLTGAA